MLRRQLSTPLWLGVFAKDVRHACDKDEQQIFFQTFNGLSLYDNLLLYKELWKKTLALNNFVKKRIQKTEQNCSAKGLAEFYAFLNAVAEKHVKLASLLESYCSKSRAERCVEIKEIQTTLAYLLMAFRGDHKNAIYCLAIGLCCSFYTDMLFYDMTRFVKDSKQWQLAEAQRLEWYDHINRLDTWFTQGQQLLECGDEPESDCTQGQLLRFETDRHAFCIATKWFFAPHISITEYCGVILEKHDVSELKNYF